MNSFETSVQLTISEQEIKTCIKDALQQNFNKRDNLRKRNPIIQFDCLLRGYVGELCIKKYLQSNNIMVDSKNNNYKKGIDVDLSYIENGVEKDIEIKTSLIPGKSQYNDLKSRINNYIRKYDIKLMRRNNESINDLKSDLHIQILFSDYIKEREKLLTHLNFNCHRLNPSKDEVDEIYQKIDADIYTHNVFFLGWIDKTSLIKHINSLDKKTWSFRGSKREFWYCSLQNHSRKPKEIINYLKGISPEIEQNKKSRFFRKIRRL